MEKFQFNQTKVAMVLAMLSLGLSVNAGVKVNEVMPCNISTLMENYNFPGWVEVYNDDAKSSVSLKGYKFVHYKSQDDGTYKYDWTWKVSGDSTVSKGGYILFFFDGSDMDSRRDVKLDSDGGILVIRNAAGAQVDSFVYKSTQTHVSYGIGDDGTLGYMKPTPRDVNGKAYSSLSSGRCAKPVFSGDCQPGLKHGSCKVTLSTTTSDAKIYYTTDGSEPNENKCEYTGSISLSSTKVIRARAYKKGMIPSAIQTGTFLFKDDKHSNGYTVPVVSISTNKKYFTDDEIGIAVKGTNGKEPEVSCLMDDGRANYLQDWTRPVNFEYIVDGKVVVTHEAEVSVMGGCSRKAKNTVKSLKIKAGNRMGSGNSKLKYDFFADKIGNKYKSLQLRNGGNAYDPRYVRCRDGFMQSVAKTMDIDYQAYQPVAYYLNGEYMGLMGLRERTNKAYVESNYGLGSTDIDVLEITNKDGVSCTCGDRTAYDNMVSFLQNSDKKSDDFYAQAAKMIDMDEYLDYEIFEQFIVNTDWPGNNSKLWREHDNGRFRWILFDTDFGFGLYGGDDPNYCTPSLNMIKWCLGESSKSNWSNDEEWKVTIFKNMMKNPTFKERFVNRFLLHLGTTFREKRVTEVWDSISSLVDEEHKAAFNEGISSHGMMTFAQERPGYVYKHLMEYYGYDSLVSLKVSSSTSDAHIMMNGELMPISSFDGKYFYGKDLKLEAVAPSGYEFLGWQLDGAANVSTENMTWKYYTSENGPSSDWKKSSFDDSSWKTGSGVMGYGSDASFYETFIKSGEEGNHYAAVFFRSTIDIQDCSNLKDVNVSILYDDSYVFYLNGEELSRANISGSPVSPTAYCGQYANNETSTFTIPASAWKKGVNVLAVEVHQHEAQSSDLTFSCEMSSLTGESQSNYISTNAVYTMTPKKGTKIKACFAKRGDCMQPNLVINEICSSNKSVGGTPDEYGNYPDWFEVYNAGNDTINLAGMYLTEKSSNQLEYMIPYGYEETKLAPKSRLVFWADEKPFRGPLHVGFKLGNKSNAMLAINMVCENNVEEVNVVEYKPLPPNNSYGLTRDGGSDWSIFGECENGIVYSPTPGEQNSSVYAPSSDCGTSDEEDIYYDEEDSSVTIYPNPVKDDVTIAVKEARSMDVNVYDNIGRLVIKGAINDATITMNFASLQAGIYHLEIITDGLTYSRTILKE